MLPISGVTKYAVKREDGFYWVKIYGDLLPAEWIVAKYFSRDNVWYISANEKSHTDKSFTEINEERILPPQN